MSQTLFQMLSHLPNQTVSLPQGASLFHSGDTVKSIFLVRSGQLALVRNQHDGNIIVLNRAKTGNILAEASIYSVIYHCGCLSEEDSTLLRVSRKAVQQLLLENSEAGQIWARYLAHELQKTRYRCELLTRNKVSDRLLGWIDWHGSLPPRGKWRALAAEIGVSPEALYREIKKQGLA